MGNSIFEQSLTAVWGKGQVSEGKYKALLFPQYVAQSWNDYIKKSHWTFFYV